MSKQTTAETIAKQARDLYHDTIYSAITASDVEQANAYTNKHLSLTVEVMDALGIFHASNRMLVAIAQAMRSALEDLEELEELEETISYKPAEPYHRYELLAYLGDCADDYDIDAIEDEATEWHDCDLYWRHGIDLWEICERHELYQYAAI